MGLTLRGELGKCWDTCRPVDSFRGGKGELKTRKAAYIQEQRCSVLSSGGGEKLVSSAQWLLKDERRREKG